MLDFAEYYGLKFADIYQRCPHWLIAGRSSDIVGRYAKDGSPRDSLGCGNKYGFDHVTCWTREGMPAVIVSQPYSLTMEDLQMLSELAQEDLDVFINGKGWYGHGTICVEIWAMRADINVGRLYRRQDHDE
jgi:hypothetical protein